MARWIAAVMLALACNAGRAEADSEGWAVAGGWYFEPAAFAVRDTADQSTWTQYQALGAETTLGVPLSRAFAWEGRTVQVFERGVLATEPTTRTVAPLALLDLASARGLDAALADRYQIPQPALERSTHAPFGSAWPETCVPCRRFVHMTDRSSKPRSAHTAERMSWLATQPDAERFYHATPQVAALLGLPTSLPARTAQHTTVRFERGALRVAAYSALGRSGNDVTVLPVGEMARTLGIFGAGKHWTPEALRRPQPTPVRAAPTPAPKPSTVARPAPAPAAPAPRTVPLAGPIVKGLAGSGTVALTFDLGLTTAGALPTVLDTLHRAGTRATFFITGAWAEAQPDLLRRMVAAGHEIANHSYSHRDLTKLDAPTARWELEHTESLSNALAAQTTQPFFRPPFGAYNHAVLALVEGLGYRLVMWTTDSGDWRPESTAGTIAERLGSRTAAGDVTVMHGYVPKTAQALPAILERIAARGLRAGTLSDALGR